MRLVWQVLLICLAFNFILALTGSSVSAQITPTSSAADRSETQDLDVLRQRGFAELRAGNWLGAHTLFEQILAVAKEDYLSLYGNGLALFNLRRIAEADNNVGAAIKILTQNRANDRLLADSIVLSSVILAGQNRTGEAIEKLKSAVGLVPDHFDANFSLGRAYFGNSDLTNAVSSFQKAVEIQPENPRARFFLATALEQSGDFENALKEYRAVLKLDPNSPLGNLGLGVLLIKLEGDKSTEGVNALKKAISINGNLYEARITLGKSLIRTNRAAEAVEHLKKAAELAPKNPEPHYQLALAFRKLGKKEEAAAELEIVKRIHEERRGVDN